MDLLLRLALLLQDTQGDPATGDGGTTGGGGPQLLVIVAGFVLIFYLVLWRPQMKERRKREEMLKGIKKGDRVVTTSGMFGTVAALSDHDVTLKVDDKNNLRLKFTRQAIQTIVNPEGAEDNE